MSRSESESGNGRGGATIAGIELGSRDPEKLAAFYCEAFGFDIDRHATSDDCHRLYFGECRLWLRAIGKLGRAVPSDSRSHDCWFRHLAIVVRDLDAAWSSLSRFDVESISDNAQTLPAWNSTVAGIEARYLRDPEGHAWELIHFPEGKGDPQWQCDDNGEKPLFLGVDHSAIVVADSAASIAFYRRHGLATRDAGSLNHGVEQERLASLPKARVRITPLAGSTERSGIALNCWNICNPRTAARIRPTPSLTTPGSRAR